MRFKEFLLEARKKATRHLSPEQRRAIDIVSEKVKKIADATNWLRVNHSDNENGTYDYKHHMSTGLSGDGVYYSISISGKYLPLDYSMDLSDLYDGDDAEDIKAAQKAKTKRMTMDERRAINDKSKRIITAFLRTLVKEDLDIMTLKSVSYYTGAVGGHATNITVTPQAAIDHFKEYHEDSVYYAPKITLNFEFVK
jgi:hypothetical protein